MVATAAVAEAATVEVEGMTKVAMVAVAEVVEVANICLLIRSRHPQIFPMRQIGVSSVKIILLIGI